MAGVDRLLRFALVRSGARAQALAWSTSAFAASIGVRIRPSEATMQPDPTAVVGIENGSNAEGRVEFVIVTTAGLTAAAAPSILVAARRVGPAEGRASRKVRRCRRIPCRAPSQRREDERSRSCEGRLADPMLTMATGTRGPRCSRRREPVRDALGDGMASPNEADPSEGGTACSRQERPMPRRA